ncbi:MtrB/PioB family outer membrane beta-barrel protein [Nitrospira lenta]|uniref:Uncharacterized protein n=1 Tax=Nitrospira lenta TaxID=1436998 RepID=A0A330KZM9_9BACT|nr:MtrB/PioB family outer membrane beta-barrel protein [Nitrospira lenta]SPP62981.1 conserved exported hypothetical protein [Nitrospira lenta]
MMWRWLVTAALVGGSCCAGGLVLNGDAAEWSAEPSLGVKGEYNSNLLLVAGSQKPVYGHWVSPGIRFAGSTENLEVSGKAAADVVRYYGGRNQDLLNLYFPLSVKYGLARETFGFDGGFTRDNTLMGELLRTGVVLSFTQRNVWNLAPSWSHAFTERLSLQASYQYSKATYEDGARLGLVDYQVQTGSAGLAYQPTENDRVQVTGVYTNFSVSTASALRSHIVGAQVSWSHAFTETLTATVTGGPQLVSSSISAGPERLTDTQTLWVANANVRKQWDAGFAEVVVSREINPSGFGLLLKTERVGLNVSHSLTDRLTASVNAQVVLASSIASKAVPFTFPENRYINVTPRLTWKFNQWWSVDAAYTYGQREVESFGERAFGSATTVMLTYYPPKLSVGR